MRGKILEALLSALPITVIVYVMALTPWFRLNRAELITFSVGAVLPILGIGLFNLGADLAMTPMGTHVGSGLSKQRKLLLLLSICFVLGVLGDKHSKENSFGLVSLCSIGPILAVMVLGMFSGNDLTYHVPDYTVSTDVLGSFLHALGHTAKEVALALGLIVVFFLLCQLLFLKLPVRKLLQIGIGVVFTYVGLVIFLTGVNVGFMPIGYQLGIRLAKLSPSVLIPFGLVIGVLVVLAEPAIHILNKQVEEVTGGYVTRKAMILGLCIGVGASIALSMVRIVFDFSIVYYVIPGYFVSLALSLFVPPVYTAIAFDSGGVASGPMTSGFILPLAVGACVGIQGADAVLRDAFGVVALVAMTPLITIQLLGFRALISNKLRERRAMQRILDADDQQIINFM